MNVTCIGRKTVMEKFILELDRKEAVMLGALVLNQKLYKTSYGPLKGLCEKIDNICKEINKPRKNG
jgi:hypothetical protein